MEKALQLFCFVNIQAKNYFLSIFQTFKFKSQQTNMNVELYFYQRLNSDLESLQVHQFCLKQAASTYFPCILRPDIPPNSS